jgi:transcriptional regulator with XRE-family HTH domain
LTPAGVGVTLAAMASSTLASRLKRARELRGIGVADLGVRVGMSRGFVSEVERGNTRKLMAETALKLARQLGVRVEWLVLGEGPMLPPESSQAFASAPERPETPADASESLPLSDDADSPV